MKTKPAQKDVDARWAKKNQEAHFGYKSHINANAQNTLIHRFKVTDAAVHECQAFEELLDHAMDARGLTREIFADSAYLSKEKEDALVGTGVEQKESNRIKSKARTRIERVFGNQAHMGVGTSFAPSENYAQRSRLA